MLFPRVETVEFHGLRLLLLSRPMADFLPYRVPGHNDLLCREKSFHALVGNADLPDPLPEDLVRKSREAVLFLNHRRNAFPLSLPEQRGAGIAADSYRYVRFELFQKFSGFAYALRHLERNLDVVLYVMPVELALEPHDRQGHNLVSCGRNLLHLHLSLRPDEENFVGGVELHQGVRYGNRRKDVSAGSPAADDDA